MAARSMVYKDDSQKTELRSVVVLVRTTVGDRCGTLRNPVL